MSAKIVNLRQARKRRMREAAAAEADRKRLKSGRTKAARARDEAAARQAEHLAAHLDGHLLEEAGGERSGEEGPHHVSGVSGPECGDKPDKS